MHCSGCRAAWQYSAADAEGHIRMCVWKINQKSTQRRNILKSGKNPESMDCSWGYNGSGHFLVIVTIILCASINNVNNMNNAS